MSGQRPLTVHRHGVWPARVNKEERRIERCLGRLLKRLRIGTRHLGWLSESRSGRRTRIALGVAFVIGGLLGFLPVLGFWMIPVGLVLLARDVPRLRRPVGRTLVLAERRWRAWRRRR